MAARVADAAGAGEVLVTDAVVGAVGEPLDVGRRRRLKAKGAPRELCVYAVRFAD